MLNATLISTIHTVADVCDHALPLNTTVLAGGGALDRPVRWVVVSNANGPSYLEGGELVIVTPEGGDLAHFIGECLAAGVAAIACPAPVDPMAVASAELANLPLLQMPAVTRVREVERAVISLLMGRRGYIETIGLNLYQQLIQLASENVGLSGIIQALAKHLKKGVVVQDKHLRVIHSAAAPALAGVWDTLLEELKERRALPEAMRDRHSLPRYTANATDQPLSNGLRRLVAPIINQSVGRGYLSIIAQGEFEDIDRLVIQHAAAVCALEMARAKAISEAEKRLRGDFLTSLMSGTVSEADAQAEGDRTGHDMNAPHIALVLRWHGPKHPSGRRLETLVNGIIGGLAPNIVAQLRDYELKIFYAPEAPDIVGAARKLATAIYDEAAREYKNAALAIGIGTAANKVAEWRSSYREAAHAADIAARLKSKLPMYAGDLGIYSLLTRPGVQDDLRSLRDNTIGELLKYEEKQRADLLQTLETFFECHGNHTQTAEKLKVHRNTLFYRMNRIAEITKLDLEQPEVRLAVHLSLKIHRLLGDES